MDGFRFVRLSPTSFRLLVKVAFDFESSFVIYFELKRECEVFLLENFRKHFSLNYSGLSETEFEKCICFNF